MINRFLVALPSLLVCSAASQRRPAQQPAPPGRRWRPARQSNSSHPETNPAVLRGAGAPADRAATLSQRGPALVDLGRPGIGRADSRRTRRSQPERRAAGRPGRRIRLAPHAATGPHDGARTGRRSNSPRPAWRPRRPAPATRSGSPSWSPNSPTPSAEVRNAARVDLAAAGEPGVVATLEALARETDPQRRACDRRRGRPHGSARPSVRSWACSTTNDAALPRCAFACSKRLHVPQAPAAHCRGDAPPATRSELLVDAIGRYQRGTPAFAADENDQVAALALGRCDQEARRRPLTRSTRPARSGSARLALRRLAQLRPDDATIERQALVLGLEADALTGIARSSTQ